MTKREYKTQITNLNDEILSLNNQNEKITRLLQEKIDNTYDESFAELTLEQQNEYSLRYSEFATEMYKTKEKNEQKIKECENEIKRINAEQKQNEKLNLTAFIGRTVLGNQPLFTNFINNITAQQGKELVTLYKITYGKTKTNKLLKSFDNLLKVQSNNIALNKNITKENIKGKQKKDTQPKKEVIFSPNVDTHDEKTKEIIDTVKSLSIMLFLIALVLVGAYFINLK